MHKTTQRKVNNTMSVSALRVKGLRKEMGMTQNELAKRLMVSRSCVANWESGTRTPDCNSIMRMSKLFKVPVDYIYGISDRRYKVKMVRDLDIDLTKLNGDGIAMLCDYYRYLAGNDKYKAK